MAGITCDDSKHIIGIHIYRDETAVAATAIPTASSSKSTSISLGSIPWLYLKSMPHLSVFRIDLDILENEHNRIPTKETFLTNHFCILDFNYKSALKNSCSFSWSEIENISPRDREICFINKDEKCEIDVDKFSIEKFGNRGTSVFQLQVEQGTNAGLGCSDPTMAPTVSCTCAGEIACMAGQINGNDCNHICYCSNGRVPVSVSASCDTCGESTCTAQQTNGGHCNTPCYSAESPTGKLSSQYNINLCAHK